MATFAIRRGPSPLKLLLVAGAAALALALAACSSTAKGSSSSTKPGTMFSTAKVSGLGTVVVDAQGRTVYVLTSGDHTNAPCTDSNGCTQVWPDLPLPDGVSAAKAGTGIQPSLLGTMKLSDGETYPTYNGWLMYEYSGDSGPGQSNGQGIKSYGGTWYVLNASGDLVTTSAASSGSGGGSGGGGGY